MGCVLITVLAVLGLVGVGVLVWLVVRSVGSSGPASAPPRDAVEEEDPNDVSVDEMVLMDMLDEDLDG